MNLDQALVRLGGDWELYRELLDMLLEDAPEQVREMREAIGRGDAKRLELAAHSLKGAAANLEAGPLRDTALWLETLARDGNLRGTVGAVAELEAELERLRGFAEALD